MDHGASEECDSTWADRFYKPGGGFVDIRTLYPNFDWKAAEETSRYYEENGFDPPTEAEIRQQKAQARAKVLGEHLGLINALMKGDRQLVMKLVNRVNVNLAKDELGYSCLHLAVVKQDPVLVHHMLQLGALLEERDRHKRTPLLLAVEKGGKEVVQMLVEAGADVTACDMNGNSILHHATANNKLDLGVIRLLMTKGAKPHVPNNDSQTPLRLAVFHRGAGFTEKMILAVKNMFNFVDNGALFAAVESGQEYLVKLLLNLGLSAKLLSPTGISLLYNAMMFRSKYSSDDVWIKVLKLLLEHGADAVEYQSPFSPIIGVVRFGSVPALKIFIDRGVDLKNEKAFSAPLLVVAANNPDVSMMKFLINQSVHHIDLKDDSMGHTALMESVLCPEDRTEHANELLKDGASVHCLDAAGNSVLFRAVENDLPQFVNLLLFHGAMIDKKVLGCAIMHSLIDPSEIPKYLIAHLVLRKSRGSEIDDEILSLIQKSKFREYFGSCESEIIALRQCVVSSSVTLYDILSYENLTKFAKDENVVNALKLLDVQRYCSAYVDLIKVRLDDVRSS
ncbi:hypothetical protein QAD02_023939 [Eretmocerus hayati]|uniref:Uncharacterized protein n=1 Tax=Eretmocerus hayati TaxID=131215 RepID=A0ACC2PZS6_9HYME|nr:hypothetical protein QAD02_023939 [Eretmocerus hayati]